MISVNPDCSPNGLRVGLGLGPMVLVGLGPGLGQRGWGHSLPRSLPLHPRARRTHRRANLPCALAIPTTRRHRVRHLHDEPRQPGDTRTGGDGVGEGDGGYGRGGGSNPPPLQILLVLARGPVQPHHPPEAHYPRGRHAATLHPACLRVRGVLEWGHRLVWD